MDDMKVHMKQRVYQRTPKRTLLQSFNLLNLDKCLWRPNSRCELGGKYCFSPVVIVIWLTSHVLSSPAQLSTHRMKLWWLVGKIVFATENLLYTRWWYFIPQIYCNFCRNDWDCFQIIFQVCFIHILTHTSFVKDQWIFLVKNFVYFLLCFRTFF